MAVCPNCKTTLDKVTRLNKTVFHCSRCNLTFEAVPVIPDTSLDIHLIDGITTFENVSATLDNNKATFDVVNELEWNIKGYFVMDNDEVTLTITDSSNEYIEKTTSTYKLHRDKSNLK